MTVEELKKKYPYSTAQAIGVCGVCKQEVGISPNAKDRSMTLSECQDLFLIGEVCGDCTIAARGKLPSIYRRPY